MKQLVSTLFFLLVWIDFSWGQQSIMEYRLKIPYDDTSKKEYLECTALIVQDSEKTGFARIKWKDKKTKQTIITDAEIIPESVSFLSHPINRETYQYKKIEIFRNINGKTNIPIIAFDLWHVYDVLSNDFIPAVGDIASTYSYKLNSTFLDMPPSFLWDAGEDSTQPDSIVTPSIVQSYKLFNANKISRKKIESYFALWEIGSAQYFSVSTLTKARKQHLPTLYCITVIDVKDTSIAKNCETDAININRYFSSLSGLLAIPYKQIEIKDKTFSVQGVNNAINRIKAKPNDIIIFAYSGHGFSYRNDEQHPFSQMALWHGDATSKAMLRASTMNLETVYNKLRAKGNRLNIILGDCCNDYVAMNRVDIVEPPVSMSIVVPRWNRLAASKLFLDTKNSYLIGATKKGEKAGSHNLYGGFFTYAFKTTLMRTMLNMNENNPTWEGIIESTKNTASDVASRYKCDGQSCQQTLIYKKARK